MGNLKAAREKKKARVKGWVSGKTRHNQHLRAIQKKEEEEKRAKEQEEKEWEKRRERARRFLGVEITRPSSSGTQGGPAPVDTTEEENRKKEEKEKTEKKEREEKERKEKK